MISAKSVRSVWRTKFDHTMSVDATAEFGISGSEINLADRHTMDYERELIRLFANFSGAIEEDGSGFDLLYSTPRRYAMWVGMLGSKVVLFE